MARSDGVRDEIWGTWEDLLLACAVNRHGDKDWDTVAMEVQSRIPCPHLLTPQSCKERYRDLQHRFKAVDRGVDGGEEEAGDGRGSPVVIPWLDELRKLRVAELRREVERYDVSIVSLQLKVKKLKEERERDRKEDAPAAAVEDGKPDKEGSRCKSDGESPASPAKDDRDRVSGERSGRSCNESNSPDAKKDSAPHEEGKGEEAAGTEAGKPDLVTGGDDKAVVGEGSCNGSSDSIERGTEEVAKSGDEDGATAPVPAPPESGESMAESKGEEAKESSDVQSSASLSKKRRGRRRKAAVSGVSSGGDSPEADEAAPVSRENADKSQPLAAFLEIIRSHNYVSIFERRLEIQDSTRYRSLIRQHVDLEMVRAKLDEGAYMNTEFFRDLLLLCNNAIVFFPKDSSESTAATRLRDLVNEEITNTSRKPTPSPQPESSAAPQPPPPQPEKPKPELDSDNSLPEKPAPVAPPLGACRKRSSISAKAAVTAVKEEEEKPDLEKELENVDKKKAKERPVARGLRTTKARGPAMKSSSNTTALNASSNPKAGSAENTTETSKTAEKKTTTNNHNANNVVDPASIAKKRSAAGFLNRLKKTTPSSPSNNGRLPLKNSGSSSSSSGKGGVEQKKGDGRKEQSLRQGSSKQTQEQNAPVKRSVGRPPKRPPPTPPSQPPAKRAREEASPPRPPRGAARKRGRR